MQKAVVLFCLLCLCLSGLAQDQNLHYAINRHGKKVGDLNFHQQKAGAITTYNIQSKVKVNMILSINVNAREESVYKDDVMQSSLVLRHVNGREKANKKIKKAGTSLVVSEDGAERELKNYSVKFNTHCLYNTEPLFYTTVFSDNYQKFIPIVKLADHHYQLTFPDGNSNEYFYENGICRKVKIKSQLFDAEFVLTSF